MLQLEQMKAVLNTFRQTIFLVGLGLCDKVHVSLQCATCQSCFFSKTGFLETDTGKKKYKSKKHCENQGDGIGSFKARLCQEQIGLSQENEVIFVSLRRTH